MSDAHEGLRKAIIESFPEAFWQRCYVHFTRNARDHMPRKADDDCWTELRWLYDRRNITEARADLAAWLRKWGDKYPSMCRWVEDNIEETLGFYRLPRAHHKHMRSTNMLERVNQEILRRTRVVRIFPNESSCLRLVQALTVEQHEQWQEGSRYLDMRLLQEQRRAEMRQLGEAA